MLYIVLSAVIAFVVSAVIFFYIGIGYRKKIAESKVLFLIALYSSDPLYKKCSCPVNSSNVSGRIPVDNGIIVHPPPQL